MNGLDCFFKGFRLIFSSGLKRYIIIPLIINIMLFSGMVYYAYSLFDGWISWLIDWLPEFLYFLSWFLWVMFYVTLLGFTFYTFTIIANIIAAPFNAVLAVQVEKKERGGQLYHPRISWYQLVYRTLAREAGKLLYYLPRLIGLVILTVLPLINLIAPLLWILFGAWMMTIQYADYAADNNGKSFLQLRIAMSRQKTDSLTFGLAVYILMFIPLVNLLVIPASVAGATVFWINNLEEQV
ncbi:MAG: sulfate transporter CysZ [Gammaproteobacteria bacterium]|nr:sulfate transporter CysZ [Gammaproteobacteria bacterium]